MYFLISQGACNDPALASILYAVKRILNLIQIIAPLLLIIMAAVHLTNLVRNPDDKKGLIKVRNALIAAAVVFFIPVFVNAAMHILGDNYTFSDCWNNATNRGHTPTYIDPSGGERQGFGSDPSEYEKGKKKSSTTSSTNNQNKSKSTSSSQTNSGASGEIGTATQTGKYYPPLAGSGHRISRASETGGCSNSPVYHDLSISVGNKIYAAFDGQVEYIQYLCNGVLYSYGNQARLTDSATGTYILYGHLSKFVGAEAAVTQTCHEVYGKNASCGAKACSSGIKKSVVLKKQVRKGEHIGYTGNTGNSEGPHLHVEIHENGSRTCVTDPYASFGMR